MGGSLGGESTAEKGEEEQFALFFQERLEKKC